MTKVKVEVTQEDIGYEPTSATHDCMVARALVRTFDRSVTVGNSFWDFEGEYQMRQLPQEVTNRILDRYGGDKEVRPFSFEVEIK